MIYTKRLDSKELPLLYSLSDINECADPSLNDCDPNAKCYNLEGTFECRCKRGYRGDGKICECECCQIYHKVYGINTHPLPMPPSHSHHPARCKSPHFKLDLSGIMNLHKTTQLIKQNTVLSISHVLYN